MAWPGREGVGSKGGGIFHAIVIGTWQKIVLEAMIYVILIHALARWETGTHAKMISRRQFDFVIVIVIWQ